MPCWRETKPVGGCAWLSDRQSTHSQCSDYSCWTPVVEVLFGSLCVSVLQSSVRDQKKLLVENSKLKKDIEQLRTQLQDKQRRRTCTLNSRQNNVRFRKRERMSGKNVWKILFSSLFQTGLSSPLLKRLASPPPHLPISSPPPLDKQRALFWVRLPTPHRWRKAAGEEDRGKVMHTKQEGTNWVEANRELHCFCTLLFSLSRPRSSSPGGRATYWRVTAGPAGGTDSSHSAPSYVYDAVGAGSWRGRERQPNHR